MEKDQGDTQPYTQVMSMADCLRPYCEGYEEEDLADQTWYVEPCSDFDVPFEAWQEGLLAVLEWFWDRDGLTV